MSSVKLMANAMPSLSVTATTREAVAETAGIGSGAGVAAGAGEEAEDDEAGATAGAAEGAGVTAAGAAVYFAGTAFGSRIASMMFSGTCALASRITSWEDRLNPVFELRIWPKIMAWETFASIIWIMLSLVST